MVKGKRSRKKTTKHKLPKNITPPVLNKEGEDNDPLLPLKKSRWGRILFYVIFSLSVFWNFYTSIRSNDFKVLYNSIFPDHSLSIEPKSIYRDDQTSICTLEYLIINEGNRDIRIINHIVLVQYENTNNKRFYLLEKFDFLNPSISKQINLKFPAGYWHPYPSENDSSLIKLRAEKLPVVKLVVTDSLIFLIRGDTIRLSTKIAYVNIYNENEIIPFLMFQNKKNIYD